MTYPRKPQTVDRLHLPELYCWNTARVSLLSQLLLLLQFCILPDRVDDDRHRAPHVDVRTVPVHGGDLITGSIIFDPQVAPQGLPRHTPPIALSRTPKSV